MFAFTAKGKGKLPTKRNHISRNHISYHSRTVKQVKVNYFCLKHKTIVTTIYSQNVKAKCDSIFEVSGKAY